MIGFDYGTSNCAVGVMSGGKPQLVELGDHGRYMSSTLYAPAREVIVNWLHDQLSTNKQIEFAKDRQPQLVKGQGLLRELALDGIPANLSFGQQALAD